MRSAKFCCVTVYSLRTNFAIVRELEVKQNLNCLRRVKRSLQLKEFGLEEFEPYIYIYIALNEGNIKMKNSSLPSPNFCLGLSITMN